MQGSNPCIDANFLQHELLKTKTRFMNVSIKMKEAVDALVKLHTVKNVQYKEVGMNGRYYTIAVVEFVDGTKTTINTRGKSGGIAARFK